MHALMTTEEKQHSEHSLKTFSKYLQSPT